MMTTTMVDTAVMVAAACTTAADMEEAVACTVGTDEVVMAAIMTTTIGRVDLSLPSASSR